MKPKIIFFGTPSFAVGILDLIYSEQYIIDAVVTSPDRKSGRGRKINFSPIKDFCIDKKIKLYQPENLKDESFITKLKNHNSDIFIVVAFRMIPKIVWSIPKKGTFNLHASLLPNYRGAAPINWAIINQEKITGVTTFLIDEKIDTGKILLKGDYKIHINETYDSLHDKLLNISKPIVIETIKKLHKGKSTPVKQNNNSLIKSAPKLTKQNTKINWNKSINEIIFFINGLNSYPGAWTNITNQKSIQSIKIFESDFEYSKHKYRDNELIVLNKKIKISHKEGFLILKNLQLPNKKRLSDIELLNGFTFEKGVFVS